MITLRPANERGHADHGWLKTFHTFSFADYYNPREVGFSALRVINDDTVAPGMGFGRHAHSNMEIISIVLLGAIEHKDSMGNTVQVTRGEIQRMSAGTGVLHSEYNPSETEPVHFLQIWIEPDREGLPPGYEQKRFPHEDLHGTLRLVCSPDGREGSLTLHQDVFVFRTLLEAGQRVSHRPQAGRRVYVHVAQGDVRLNGQLLTAGSGARVEGEPEVRLEGVGSSDVLVFDLP